MYGMTHKSALPDVALYELYDRLKDAGRFHETFYDGEIEDSHHGFRDYARRPDIHLWALIHGGELSGMCWLTHVCHGGTAFAHFAMLPNLHPLVTLRLGRFAVASMLRLRDERGAFILEALHGTTPVRRPKAVRWVQKVGFVSVGELPYAVFMADTGRNEPGLISYADRTTAPGAWCGEKGWECTRGLRWKCGRDGCCTPIPASTRGLLPG